MARKKSPTRAQKEKNTSTKRNSKYAQKVAQRNRANKKMGYKVGTPYPVMWEGEKPLVNPLTGEKYNSRTGKLLGGE